MVTAIDAAILALITNKVASYDVEGTAYRYHDLDKLRAMHKHYAAIARSSGSRFRLADIS